MQEVYACNIEIREQPSQSKLFQLIQCDVFLKIRQIRSFGIIDCL